MGIEESLAALVASLRSGASFESIIRGDSSNEIRNGLIEKTDNVNNNYNSNNSESYFQVINIESVFKWIDSRCSNRIKNLSARQRSKVRKDMRKVAQSLMSVYELSSSIGCSMTDCVQAVSDSYHANKRVNDLSSEVFAMPKATIRLLTALPFLALLTGQLLGVNPVLMIFTSSRGYALLGIGLLFYAIGLVWVTWIMKSSKKAMLSTVSNVD